MVTFEVQYTYLRLSVTNNQYLLESDLGMLVSKGRFAGSENSNLSTASEGSVNATQLNHWGKKIPESVKTSSWFCSFK